MWVTAKTFMIITDVNHKWFKKLYNRMYVFLIDANHIWLNICVYIKDSKYMWLKHSVDCLCL